MNLLLVSDLHLSPESEARNREFIAFLRSAQQEGESVIIAGDLFDLWFGWPKFTFEYQEEILTAIRESREAGLHIEYVEGNRDFSIARYEGVLFNRVSPRYIWLEWGGRKIYVEHGDLINQSDRQYRLWRGISKNQLSLSLLGSLPRCGVLRYSLRAERKMRNTNLKYKAEYPVSWVEKLYLNRFSEGADVVVVGHFHQERSVELSIGERTVLFYNLPGWEDGFRYLVIPDSGGKPFFKELN